jgi:hypothetical protein
VVNEASEAQVEDPLGRSVRLDNERWAHIVDARPMLADHRDKVLGAIESPDHHIVDVRPGEDWYYLAGVGPSRWLKVVVAFHGESSGRVITAFPRRAMP